MTTQKYPKIRDICSYLISMQCIQVVTIFLCNVFKQLSYFCAMFQVMTIFLCNVFKQLPYFCAMYLSSYHISVQCSQHTVQIGSIPLFSHSLSLSLLEVTSLACLKERKQHLWTIIDINELFSVPACVVRSKPYL